MFFSNILLLFRNFIWPACLTNNWNLSNFFLIPKIWEQSDKGICPIYAIGKNDQNKIVTDSSGIRSGSLLWSCKRVTTNPNHNYERAIFTSYWQGQYRTGRPLYVKHRETKHCLPCFNKCFFLTFYCYLETSSDPLAWQITEIYQTFF